MVFKYEFSFDSLKLELISNAAPIKSVSHDESNTIYEKDYYVFVIDDFNKVKIKIRQTKTIKSKFQNDFLMTFSFSIFFFFKSLII